MRKCFLVLRLVCCIAVTNVALAQDPSANDSSAKVSSANAQLVPEAAAAEPIELDIWGAVVVELEDDSKTLVIESARLATQMQPQTAAVHRMVQQTRTRTVVVNGEPVEQTYTINVPITQTVTPAPIFETEGQAPRARVKTTTVRAWNLEGEPIKLTDLVTRLSSRRAVFLLPQAWGEQTKIHPLHKELLSEDALFLYIPQVAPSDDKP